MITSCIISAIWRHSNIQINLSDDWYWSDDIDQDLHDAWEGWNLSSLPFILKNVEFPPNWVIGEVIESPYVPNPLDHESMELFLPPKPIWSKIASAFPSWFTDFIIPNQVDPIEWIEQSREEKLQTMGQAEGFSQVNDDNWVSLNNTIYFDFYVSGAISVSIETFANTTKEATILAKQELEKFFDSNFEKKLSRALPNLHGDPNLDESIAVLEAPHWVMISKSSD